MSSPTKAIAVWKTHGKVCGANSNPFRPPDFFPDELELVKRNMQVNIADRVEYSTLVLVNQANGVDLRHATQALLLARLFRLPFQDSEQNILDVLEDTSRKTDWSEETRSKTLKACRRYLHIFELGRTTRAADFRSTNLFTLQAALTSSLDVFTPLTQAEQTRAHHQALMLVTLLRHANSQPLPAAFSQSTLDSFCAAAHEQFLNLVFAAFPFLTAQEATQIVAMASDIVASALPTEVTLGTTMTAEGQRRKARVTLIPREGSS
ncbi:hypothetical protein JCM10207_004886 [Rhodosporidiobolus poonsookiae]